jgi:tRNA (mo5U34)-methyltransferase
VVETLQFPVDCRHPLTVINTEALLEDLDRIGLSRWRVPLGRLLEERVAPGVHGDLAAWQRAIEALPAAADTGVDGAFVREQLQALAPWRKGPFDVAGIRIDAEWRSDMKWARLEDAISPLDGRVVLDVGCGNGYYAMRMRDAGASVVIGIDPTLLFVAQHTAIRKLTSLDGIHVLPLRMEDLPAASHAFDTTFSMGVLYHRRTPADHLAALRGSLRQGGELVLETLVLPGEHREVLEPAGRYARMRNVWHLPTVSALTDWVTDAGFLDIRVIDVTRTTPAEQRTTGWMPFESLAEALDPTDPSRTIEGLPAPTRALLIARAP